LKGPVLKLQQQDRVTAFHEKKIAKFFVQILKLDTDAFLKMLTVITKMTFIKYF